MNLRSSNFTRKMNLYYLDLGILLLGIQARHRGPAGTVPVLRGMVLLVLLLVLGTESLLGPRMVGIHRDHPQGMALLLEAVRPV